MAAILDAMGPYVMQLIADMATEEVKMLLGISGDIEKLENNMESIKCFLADAERKRITELSVQRWVQKLKNAMYDATDILDLCQIEADKQSESKGSSLVEKAPGCCQPLLSCLRKSCVRTQDRQPHQGAQPEAGQHIQRGSQVQLRHQSRLPSGVEDVH